LPLLLVERKNKKTKSYCDWNWLDALAVGFFGALFVIPGAGLTLGLLLGALFRNYKREAAVKFVLLVATLFFLIQGLKHTSEVNSLYDLPDLTSLNWISLVLTLAGSITASVMGIKFFMKNIEFKTFNNYTFYRGLIAVCSIAAFWFRNR
jgi:undecaprenyl-diphosphatase